MKTPPKPRVALILSGAIAVFLLFFAVACSDDDDSSQQGSESAVCGDVDAFESSVSQVKGLNTSSSIDDISKSLASLRTSWTDLQSSLKDAKYDKTDEIQAVTSDLQSSLVSAVTSGSAAQAQTQINSAVQNVQKDLDNAKSSLNCN